MKQFIRSYSPNGCPCPEYNCLWNAHETKPLLVLSTWGYDEAEKMYPNGDLEPNFDFEFDE